MHARLFVLLFEWYRTRVPEAQRLVLDHLPSLLRQLVLRSPAHDSATAQPTSESSLARIEALLLSIYSASLNDADGRVIVRSYRHPTLADRSVYHDVRRRGPAPLAGPVERPWLIRSVRCARGSRSHRRSRYRRCR